VREERLQSSPSGELSAPKSRGEWDGLGMQQHVSPFSRLSELAKVL
jgi:hypothetical protein